MRLPGSSSTSPPGASRPDIEARRAVLGHGLPCPPPLESAYHEIVKITLMPAEDPFGEAAVRRHPAERRAGFGRPERHPSRRLGRALSAGAAQTLRPPRPARPADRHLAAAVPGLVGHRAGVDGVGPTRACCCCSRSARWRCAAPAAPSTTSPTAITTARSRAPGCARCRAARSRCARRCSSCCCSWRSAPPCCSASTGRAVCSGSPCSG